ncbi:MAG: SIR2 family protein [Anaerolineales bacterium]|jgi:hypothetical protein
MKTHDDMIKGGEPLKIPDDILKSGKAGECILFLGAMASAPSPEDSPYHYKKAPPGGAELSRRLAERCGYPSQDVTNLPRVALYYERRPGGSRRALVQAIKDEISGPGDDPYLPSPALEMLAALPFRIIITTNYDRLFDIALSRANTKSGRPKIPIVHKYNPSDDPPKMAPLDPEEERPVFLKLHGDIEVPESVVVTEEDYIRFIQKMSVVHLHPIHEHIRARMNTWPILFIGYSLKDYNLRLLFRTLRWHLDVADIPLSFSVDPYPDDLIISVWQHGDKPMVSFVEHDLWDFVPLLYKECTGVDYHE